MPGSHLFNFGLYQKKFCSTSRVTGPAINLGCTRGRGSTTRMFNYCTAHSSTPSLCINEFITIKNTPPNSDFLCYLEGRGPGSGILDTNFGWDSDGVWFSGEAGTDNPSYPIFTNFTIPANKMVKVSVDFIYNEACSDFGLCFYENNTVPEWSWDINNTRIACQYACPSPFILGLTDSTPSYDVLISPNKYTCEVIYNPNSNPNVTLNTKLDGVIIDTITLDNQTLNTDYRIGFTADQDNDSFKTYIENLTININNNETIYSNSLKNITIQPFNS